MANPPQQSPTAAGAASRKKRFGTARSVAGLSVAVTDVHADDWMFPFELAFSLVDLVFHRLAEPKQVMHLLSECKATNVPKYISHRRDPKTNG